jgi:threonine aldolase
MNTIKAAVAKHVSYRDPQGPIQPIQLTGDTFLYQLDAPLDAGGCNLWSGNLQANNGFNLEYATKAAKLFAAAPALLAALEATAGVRAFKSDANMVLVRIEGPGERAATVFAGLKAHGVLVKNISKMHPLLANCLRLTVGTADENRALLQALRQSL